MAPAEHASLVHDSQPGLLPRPPAPSAASLAMSQLTRSAGSGAWTAGSAIVEALGQHLVRVPPRIQTCGTRSRQHFLPDLHCSPENRVMDRAAPPFQAMQ